MLVARIAHHMTPLEMKDIIILCKSNTGSKLYHINTFVLNSFFHLAEKESICKNESTGKLAAYKWSKMRKDDL